MCVGGVPLYLLWPVELSSGRRMKVVVVLSVVLTLLVVLSLSRRMESHTRRVPLATTATERPRLTILGK